MKIVVCPFFLFLLWPWYCLSFNLRLLIASLISFLTWNQGNHDRNQTTSYGITYQLRDVYFICRWNVATYKWEMFTLKKIEIKSKSKVPSLTGTHGTGWVGTDNFASATGLLWTTHHEHAHNELLHWVL
jgi:hypothetical protein